MIATSIEAALGTRYTVDTLRLLRRRFPRVHFVWIMGADMLTQLPRWHRWQEIVRDLPFAVLPRPGYTLPALAGQAAQRLRGARRPAHEAPVLSRARSGWVFLTAHRECHLRHRDPRSRTTSGTPWETKEPYHSRHAQAARLTRAPSAQTAEARREARAGGGAGVARLAAQEDHRRRPGKAAPRSPDGEGGTVAIGLDATADREQPGG